MNENKIKKLRNRVDTIKYSPVIFFSLFISTKLENGFYDTKRENRLCSLHLRAKVTKCHYIFFPCPPKAKDYFEVLGCSTPWGVYKASFLKWSHLL